MNLERDEQKRLNELYERRIQVLDAMEAKGACSKEVARQQRQARRFQLACVNVNTNIAARVRLRSHPVRALSTFALYVIICTLVFRFVPVSWPSAIALGIITTFTIDEITTRLKVISRNCERMKEIVVYSLARDVARDEGMSVYEARAKFEYMRHVDAEFNSDLMEKDPDDFWYQMSEECNYGHCSQCRGIASSNLACLHNCHADIATPSRTEHVVSQ
jgi:hypothetical protein